MSARFKFFPQLYISENIDPGKLFFIRSRIKRGRRGYYIIVPSESDTTLLEIFSSSETKNRLYDGRRFIVGGIADSKSAAIGLVALITSDCQRIRGDLNLKEFISCGQFF